MSNSAYTGTPSQVNPAATQLFPNWLANPLGSEYAAQYGYSDTRQLAAAIHNMIVDSIPSQYKTLKLLFDKAPIDVNDEEHFWFERGIPRPALTVLTNTSGGATMAIPLTAGGASQVSINTAIVMPNGRSAIVYAVNTTTNTISVKPQNGEPNLANVVAGDKLIVGFTPMADGQNFFSDYTRLNLSQYSNFIARGQRAKRWTTMTALKYKNNQTVDYFEKDAAVMMENVYNDMFYLFMDANKGEFDITVPADAGLTAGTYKAKVGDGIFPFIRKNGGVYSSSSPATLESDFKTLAFGTNYKAVDQPRFVLGTPKLLNLMSDVWKDPIRYTASDRINSMDLMEYRFGEMRFVPIPIVHFEGRFNQFQAEWENRLFCIDMDSINTTKVRGMEQIMARNTAALAQVNGGTNDYIDYFVQYMLGTRVNTVQGHFWMDMVGV